MSSIAFVLAWIAVGLVICFVAFNGGPEGTRESLAAGARTRGFSIVIPLIYLAFGIALPALVIIAQS